MFLSKLSTSQLKIPKAFILKPEEDENHKGQKIYKKDACRNSSARKRSSASST